MTFKTNLSRESLRELQAIAENKQLRPHIRTLFIHGVDELGQGFVWDRHPSGHLSAPLQAPAVQTLRDILLYKLVNCRSFHIFCDYWEDMLETEALIL